MGRPHVRRHTKGVRLRYPDVEMARRKRRKSRQAPLAAAAHRSEPRASILDASERAILQSVERGEWPRVLAVPTDKARYARYAKMTLQRLRRA
jgi:hypothetical protein